MPAFSTVECCLGVMCAGLGGLASRSLYGGSRDPAFALVVGCFLRSSLWDTNTAGLYQPRALGTVAPLLLPGLSLLY